MGLGINEGPAFAQVRVCLAESGEGSGSMQEACSKRIERQQ